MLTSLNHPALDVPPHLLLRQLVLPVMKYFKQQADKLPQFLGNSMINHCKLPTRLQIVYLVHDYHLNLKMKST